MTDGRLTYRVKEAAALLGLPSRTLYDAVALGRIPSLKVGRT